MNENRAIGASIVAAILKVFHDTRSAECVKTLCDRRWLDQISTAKFAGNERVQILKLEFSLPV